MVERALPALAGTGYSAHMRHKVSELDGALLDAAVFIANGHPKGVAYLAWDEHAVMSEVMIEPTAGGEYTTRLIEREKISAEWLGKDAHGDLGWRAHYPGKLSSLPRHVQRGPTHTIACLRAFVHKTFGDEVDLPKEN